MPKVNAIVRGDEIGKRSNDYYIWLLCPLCQKGRWVLKWKLKLTNFTRFCQTCSAPLNSNRSEAMGIKHPRWNNGQTQHRGYIYTRNGEHPARTSRGYVKRARLMLEEKLGRYLLPNCVPHHINGVKADDRPRNLIEVTKSQHTILHAYERQLLAKGKTLGIKTVVDWIHEHNYRVNPWLAGIAINAPQWIAKLKEWEGK